MVQNYSVNIYAFFRSINIPFFRRIGLGIEPIGQFFRENSKESCEEKKRKKTKSEVLRETVIIFETYFNS